MTKMTMKALKVIGYSLLEEHEAEATIKFKDIRRGRATDNKYISIPKWSLGWGKSFSIYYVVHEVCHIILFSRGQGFSHSKAFKSLECTLLERFDIVPIYSRAYPKMLLNKKGKILWKRT